MMLHDPCCINLDDVMIDLNIDDVLGFWWLTNWLTDGQRLLLSCYRNWKAKLDKQKIDVNFSLFYKN